MAHAPQLLVDLALVLGSGFLASMAFRALKLPAVLGYLLAGFLVGPHTAGPLVGDQAQVQTLAELGVSLLMFGIGLEFSLQRLWRAGPTALLMGSVQVGLGLVLGYLAALGLGWSRTEAIFVGAALGISSTMVVAKLMEAKRPPKAVQESVFAVLVIQDLFAILLLTGLTAFVRVGGLTAGELGHTLLRLALFLAVVLGLGRLVIPRILRHVADHMSPESLLVASGTLCFGLAVAAAKIGFSVALGAFLAGMLAAESGRVRAVEHVVWPLRDLFTVIFFVSVGMMLDPKAFRDLLPAVVLLALLVIVANTLSLTAGGLLAGLSLPVSLRTGLALGQIGEFGFIILGTGIAAGVVRPELYTLAVGVALLTAFSTPFAMDASESAARRAEEALPDGLRSSLGLYQAWAESLRRRGIRHGDGRELRRPALLLVADSALLAGLVVGHHFLSHRLALWVEGRLDWGHLAAQALVTGLLGVSAALLVMGALRQVRLLARDMAVLAPNPEAEGSGRRGRHLLAGGLRMAVLLTAGLPLLGVLQPFAPKGPLFLVVAVVFLGTLLFQLHRGRRLARELPGPLEWLLEQVQHGPAAPVHGRTLRHVKLTAGCPALGHTLHDLDLEVRSGVTLVGMLRGGDTLVHLKPSPTLEIGDLLVLAGPEPALEAAEETLLG